MCYYEQTHVNCGHAQKISFDPSMCNCKLNKKTKTTKPADAPKTDTEKPQKKNHGKAYGEFKGEVVPLRDSWCPKCLIEQKAKIFDHVQAGSLGDVLNQVLVPGGPKIHPAKVHANKKPKALKEQSKEDSGIQHEYKVPKWELKWEGKSRGKLKREIREYKMKMVDEIRALRNMAKESGVDMDKLAEKIRQLTGERKAAEANKKAQSLEKKQANIEKTQEEIEKKAKDKVTEKAEKAKTHLQHQLEWNAKILYRI